ncbi:MAG: hypothetical protein CSA21_08150 [Deltaproteobacteria bacterium]|nr:MAG: hypothetical protein CSA21_08150 [Deltaproteobacteria bacterium]
MMKFDADLGLPETDCDGGYDPESEFADMQFVTTDILANTHELDLTSLWTTADDTTAGQDPNFTLWYCASLNDTDGDGVEDHLDNCPLTANASQLDGDDDGIGNACDADLNNDGKVNQIDGMIFRGLWGTSDTTADFNGDGVVNQIDGMMFRDRWGATYPWY